MADAFGADWSKTDGLIALNRRDVDGLYHVFTVRPDGTDLRRLGVGSSTFPQRTTGSPSWSPDGNYIAFAAEKADHPGNSRAWQLADLPVGPNDRTILPLFSPDGRLLEWTQQMPAPDGGFYFVIELGNFGVSPDGTPTLADTRTVDPGGAFPREFIETGGFSADSSTMLFTSDYQSHVWTASQIYALDLATGAITRLTKGNSYNEHPRFTPDGRVIWMSDADQPPAHGGGDDWWLMNADGSDPHKLTHFNDPSSPQYFGRTVFATVVDTDNWGTDGSYFYGDLEVRLLTAESDILRVSLACH